MLADVQNMNSEPGAAESIRTIAEAEFRAIVDSNIIGIIRFNEERILSANDYVLQMLGYGLPEFLDPAFDWRAMVDVRYRSLVDERILRMKQNGFFLPFNSAYTRKDGSRVDVVAGLVLTRKDPFEWLLFIQDQSEQKRVLKALTESEELNRAVLEILAEGIVVRDNEGRVVFANEAACQLLGAGSDQLTGSDVNDTPWRVVDQDGAPIEPESLPFIVALRTGESVRGFTMGIHRVDGTFVWVRLNSRPLRDPSSGAITSVVSSFTDITDLMRAEQVQRERAERESLTNRIGEAIRSTFEPLKIQERVTALLGDALQLDRCYYIRYNKSNDSFYRSTGYRRPGLADISGRRRASESKCDRNKLYGRGTVVCSDTEQTGLLVEVGFDPEQRDHAAVIAVPFFDGDQFSAALVAAMTTPREWTRDEVELMERVATMTSSAVLAADYVLREVTIAQRLQDALQPSIPAQVAGLRLASYYRPALDEARVGGDFVDVFAADEDTTYLVLGDVSGKGLAAASQVAMVRNMLRLALLSAADLNTAIEQLNTIITAHEQLSGFVTLFVGRYEASTRTLSYVNCGHEAGLILRSYSGVVEELDTTGMALGAYEPADYEMRSVRLSPADLLVVFTDGFSEARVRQSKLLTREGVARLIQEQYPVTHPQQLIDNFVAALDKRTLGSVRDDQCMLAIMG